MQKARIEERIRLLNIIKEVDGMKQYILIRIK
jgi:hypothetical protein